MHRTDQVEHGKESGGNEGLSGISLFVLCQGTLEEFRRMRPA
jgi:hypothetical protein